MPPFAVLLIPLLVPPAPPRLDADGLPLPAGAVCRIGSARFLHPDGVYSLAVSPDGRTLYTTSQNQIYVWDADTGRPVAAFPVNGYLLWSDCLRTDRTGLRAWVLKSSDASYRYLRLDPATGRVLEEPSPVTPQGGGMVGLSPGGRYYAMLQTEKQGPTELRRMIVYETAGGRGPVELWAGTTVHSFVYSPDDRHLGLVDGGAAVVVHDLGAGREVGRWETGGLVWLAHDHVGFAPDGRTVAVWVRTGDRWGLHLWDLPSGRKRLLVSGGTGWPTGPPLFTPDGSAVLADRAGDTFVFVGTATGAVARRVTVRSAHPWRFSPDGRYLFLRGGGHNSRVFRIDWASGTARPRADGPTDVHAIGFRADGTLVAAAGDAVYTCDPRTGQTLTRVVPDAPGFGSWRWNSTVAPDGTAVAFTAGDQTAGVAMVCDPVDGRALARRDVGIDYAQPLQFARGSAWLAGYDGGGFRIWDRAGRTVRESAAFVIPIWAIRPDGGAVAWSGRNSAEDTTIFYQTLTGPVVRRTFRAGAHGARQVLFSADGRELYAVGSYSHQNRGYVYGWVADTGASAFPPMLFDSRLEVAAASPDGRTLAVVGYGGVQLRVIERATGGTRRQFPTHPATMAFAPDGKTLAAVYRNGEVLIWDLWGDPPTPPGANGLDAAWADLASADATAAFRAVRLLAHCPEPAVPFLRKKLPPARGPTPTAVAELIARLDAPAFADREAAAAELKTLGPLAGPALRQAVAATASAEVRQRAERLLAPLAAGKLSTDQVRAVRAVEAVEWMGTPAAEALLAQWAAGAAGARLTEEARRRMK